jgi:hypothetical protein
MEYIRTFNAVKVAKDVATKMIRRALMKFPTLSSIVGGGPSFLALKGFDPNAQSRLAP